VPGPAREPEPACAARPARGRRLLLYAFAAASIVVAAAMADHWNALPRVGATTSSSPVQVGGPPLVPSCCLRWASRRSCASATQSARGRHRARNPRRVRGPAASRQPLPLEDDSDKDPDWDTTGCHGRHLHRPFGPNAHGRSDRDRRPRAGRLRLHGEQPGAAADLVLVVSVASRKPPDCCA
jgi:hypothetical protein